GVVRWAAVSSFFASRRRHTRFSRDWSSDVCPSDLGMIEAFMRQYDLGSEEGVLLMCVAEALLRIPDAETTDLLIRDKLGEADWKRHMGQSHSLLVNASTWGLMLTGELVDLADETKRDVHGAFKRLAGRLGEP